jgi:hypothetical protein
MLGWLRNQAKSQRAGARFGRALVHALALVFLLQGYVVQSHIHIPGPSAAKAFGEGSVVVADDRSDAPSHGRHHDDQQCPICQHGVSAGAYLAALPPGAPPPDGELGVESLFALADNRAARVSFAWQSRAPPSLSDIANV